MGSTGISRTFKVGIICGSQRIVRAGPQIATFVQETIATRLAAGPAHPSGASFTLESIDIAALNLPLSDESGVPSKIHSAEGYDHEHTRSWSRRVASLDAFVFVTPQYNWSIPAGLKNAIDHLFHEWRGKPAAIVAYGGHGGGKCAAALTTVLGGGIGMRVVEPPVCMSFPDREFLIKAATGQELELDGTAEEGPWSDQKAGVLTAWESLVAMLVEEKADAA